MPMRATLWAMSRIWPTSSPLSVVIDCVAALRKRNSRSGRSSSDDLVASWTTEDRNACWRSMRPRSDPSPTVLRTRT